MNYFDFEPPIEYISLNYLRLGDIGNVKAICNIWNHLHKDFVKVKVLEERGTIVLKGWCSDADSLKNICDYYRTPHVLIVDDTKPFTSFEDMIKEFFND